MADFRAALGRGTDRMMGHLTPGELVIPPNAVTPKLWSAFQEAMDKQGMMPEQYIVGSGMNSVNPRTGTREFLAMGAIEKGTRPRDPADLREAPEGGTADRVFSGPITDWDTSEQRQAVTPQEPSMMESVVNALTPTADQPGFLGAIPLVGPGMYLGQKYGGGFTPGERAKLDELELSRRDKDPLRMQGMSRQRAIDAMTYFRPEPAPTPAFLGLSSAMSPLQMRSAVASRAVAGGQGEYTSPEAATFYDNLLRRALISDTGDLYGLDTLLPIDLQYLAQIRGIQSPADTQSLLAALQ